MQALHLDIWLPWPLSLVVDAKALRLYNAVLVFLMQVEFNCCLQCSLVLFQCWSNADSFHSCQVPELLFGASNFSGLPSLCWRSASHSKQKPFFDIFSAG